MARMSLIIYGRYCVNYCCFDECAEGKVEKSDGTNQDWCKTTSGIYIHVNRLISKTKGAIVIMKQHSIFLSCNDGAIFAKSCYQITVCAW